MTDTLLTPTDPIAPPIVETPGETPAAGLAPPPIVDTPAERDWTKAINADGSFDPKAHEYGIPEHWKSVGGIVESYKDLQRLKGAPGAEGTPEQISAYRQANGIPEVVSAESYGIELPEALQGSYPPEVLDSIMQAANDSSHLGHTEMMKAVISKFGEFEVAGRAAEEQETQEQLSAKLAASAQALEADPNFAGERKTAALQTTANGLNASLTALGEDPNSDAAKDIARNPLMLRVIHHFASKTTQDNTNIGGSISDLRSQEEQGDDVINNPTNPLYAAYHAGDPVVGKQVLRMMGLT